MKSTIMIIIIPSKKLTWYVDDITIANIIDLSNPMVLWFSQ
jgi:hypothetical protein